MLTLWKSKLESVPAWLGLPDLKSLVRALPLPEPIERLATWGIETISDSLDAVATALGLTDPAPKTTSSAREPRKPAGAPEEVRKPRVRRTETAARTVVVPKTDLKTLLRTLDVADADVAASAATALGILGGDDARTALLAVLANRKAYYHAMTRAASVEALGHLLGDDALAPIHAALRDVEADVSVAAIEALASRGGPDASRALIEVLEDRSGFFLSGTRLAAACGLARVGALDHDRIEHVFAMEKDEAVADVLGNVIATSREDVDA